MGGVGEVVCSEIVTVVGRKISTASSIIDQILFAVLIGVYCYMSHTMQQEIGEPIESNNPNPNFNPP